MPVESGTDVPFKIERLFWVTGTKDNKIRGKHAHRAIFQVLTCIKGHVTCVVKDGKSEKTFELVNFDQGLLIPPMIWAEQIYHSEDAVLHVICSEHFSEADYIHDFEEFRRLKNANTKT